MALAEFQTPNMWLTKICTLPCHLLGVLLSQLTKPGRLKELAQVFQKHHVPVQKAMWPSE